MVTVLRDYHVPKSVFDTTVLSAAGVSGGGGERRELSQHLKVQIGKVSFMDLRVAAQHIKDAWLRLLEAGDIPSYKNRYILGDFNKECGIPVSKNIFPDKYIVDVISKGVAGGGKEYVVELPDFFTDILKKGKSFYWLGELSAGEFFEPTLEDESLFDEFVFWEHDGKKQAFGVY